MDTVPSAAYVTVSEVLCADQRILVTLHDEQKSHKNTMYHLILVVLSQEELQQSGLFSNTDAAEVIFDRADTIARPDCMVKNLFYSFPRTYDAAFEHEELYVLENRLQLHDYIDHLEQMMAEFEGTSALDASSFVPQDSEAYFEQYRTLILEEDTRGTEAHYQLQGLQASNDGIQTMILKLVEPEEETYESEEDIPLTGMQGFERTVRATVIDIPRENTSGMIKRVETTDSRVLWEHRYATGLVDSSIPISLIYCQPNASYPENGSEMTLVTDVHQLKAQFSDVTDPVLSAYLAKCDDTFFEKHALLVAWMEYPSSSCHIRIDRLDRTLETLIVSYSYIGPQLQVDELGTSLIVLELDAQSVAGIDTITEQRHEEFFEGPNDIPTDIWSEGSQGLAIPDSPIPFSLLYCGNHSYGGGSGATLITSYDELQAQYDNLSGSSSLLNFIQSCDETFFEKKRTSLCSSAKSAFRCPSPCRFHLALRRHGELQRHIFIL